MLRDVLMPCGHPVSQWGDEKPRTYGLGEYHYYTMCKVCGAKYEWCMHPSGATYGDKYTPPETTMKREIHSHETNAVNKAIVIVADDRDPAKGNSSHHYELRVYRTPEPNAQLVRTNRLDFQDGPIKEVGIKGITNEVLLAVVIDRLEGFQSGDYKSDFNAKALAHLRAGLSQLEQRPRERTVRGVEGELKP